MIEYTAIDALFVAPLVAGILSREFSRNWQAWVGLGITTIASSLIIWSASNISFGAIMVISSSLAVAGSFGREIYQGIAHNVQRAIQRYLFPVVLVAGFFGTLKVLGPDQTAQLVVPIAILLLALYKAKSLMKGGGSK